MEQNSISSDLIRGHIDTIILHSLTDGDKFAQQISDFIENKSQNQYKINQATLYSSLKRLETLKYVTSYMNDIDGGRRKFFKITPSGATFVEENMSSWSHSRAIIDKLIGTEEKMQNNQYLSSEINDNYITPKVVEKIVYIEKPIEVPVKENGDNIIKENTESVKILSDNPLNNADNFRSVLGNLIDSSVPKTTKIDEKIELLSTNVELKEENLPKNNTILEEKVSFNQVISDNNYNCQKSNNNGKIDFGDLMIKASQEGYKIRISAKDSASSNGNVLINKVRFISVLFVYLLATLQFSLLRTFFTNIIANNTYLTVILGLLIFPLLFAIVFFKNPDKRSAKKFSGDRILTSFIIAFNLILVTLAVNFIFNVNFNDTYSVICYLVLPLLTIVNCALYSVFEYTLANKKKFNTLKK